MENSDAEMPQIQEDQNPLPPPLAVGEHKPLAVEEQKPENCEHGIRLEEEGSDDHLLDGQEEDFEQMPVNRQFSTLSQDIGRLMREATHGSSDEFVDIALEDIANLEDDDDTSLVGERIESENHVDEGGDILAFLAMPTPHAIHSLGWC